MANGSRVDALLTAGLEGKLDIVGDLASLDIAADFG